MSKIIQVVIQPETQGQTEYNLNKYAIYIPGMPVDEMPKVTKIELFTDEHGNTSISIYVNAELYCMYENVPYKVVFETSFNKA